MGISKQQEVLEALKDGCVRRHKLFNGRRAAFRLAYRELVKTGAVVESGTGAMGNPIYSGLPGCTFPPKREYLRIRPADVRLMVRAGWTKQDARVALEQASISNDLQGVIDLLEEANQLLNQRLIQNGGAFDVPRVGRPRKQR